MSSDLLSLSWPMDGHLRAEPAPIVRTGHIAALDGVRGVAVVMVLVFHFYFSGNAIGLLCQDANWLARLLGKFFSLGALGVDLFFVLSGFLITGILLDAKGGPHFFRNFYARRFLRIFPLYYGMLFAVLVALPVLTNLGMAFTGDLHERQAWLWYYAVNLPPASSMAWHSQHVDLSHLWSLALEEQFYLLWPLVVYVLPRKAMLNACMACVILAMAARGWMVCHGFQEWAVAVFPLCRIDSLALGGAIAILARGDRGLDPVKKWMPQVLVLAAILTAALVFRPGRLAIHGLEITAGALVHALFFASALVLVLTAPRAYLSRMLTLSPLRTLGRYSYGMYVLHYLFAPYYARWFPAELLMQWTGSRPAGWLLQMALLLVATFAAAYLSWHLYEKQFLKLKRFFEYRAAPSLEG
jgi:peptidoglycan/LPS O-acetylase OafA/YrhL